MRILSPIAGPHEAAPLIEGGADEFYCGIFPQEWYAKWGRGAWPNRRGPGPANLETLDQMKALAAAVHGDEGGPRAGQQRADLYAAFNQQYYPDDQADFLLEIARSIWDEGAIDAFIVTDPGFMASLKAAIPDIRIFASTVSVALNADSVRFFEDLGCERTILSRHMEIRELATLREAVPDAALEVFLMNDNCYFEEGFCSTTHTMPGFGVYCMTPWELKVLAEPKVAGQDSPQPISDPEERARWDFLIEEHREYIRHLGNRGHGEGRTAMPLGPCGLCAIPELMDLGIHSGKIVGREANLFRKIRSVQGVRYIRDLYAETGDKRAVKRAAVELRGDPQGCSDGYSCYYRSARDRSVIPLPTRPRGPKRPPKGRGTKPVNPGSEA